MEFLIESELELAMWSALETQYGLCGGTLYRYLVLRSRVENVRKGRLKTEEAVPFSLTRFLMKEWGWQNEETAVFQGTELKISTTGRTGIHRILEDWHVQYTFMYARGQFETEMEKEFGALLKEAKSKTRKWTRKPFYEMALKQAYLEKLNTAFEIVDVYKSTVIEDLQTACDTIPVRLELQYERHLHPYFIQHTDAALLDEKSIEDYLVSHLAEVEDGLRLIGRQIVLERGRIDLLARDKDGAHVIIEVKVATDTDLVWQQAYYMKEIKNLYGGDVRFMVIAPKWEPHIMGLLLQAPNTQIHVFTPVVEQRKIHTLTFKEKYAS